MRDMCLHAIRLGFTLRAHAPIDNLVASFLQHGYQSGQYFDSEDRPIAIDSEGVVVFGRLRVLALRWLAQNNLPAFQRILPTGRILVSLA